MLGHIFREQGDAECRDSTIRKHQPWTDESATRQAEAIVEYNLGNAYKNLPAIRDLDAAEAAYRRSLNLCNPNDDLGRSKCINQIGMVHHGRFLDALQRKEPAETLAAPCPGGGSALP